MAPYLATTSIIRFIIIAGLVCALLGGFMLVQRATVGPGAKGPEALRVR
jgi:hypothetical protein